MNSNLATEAASEEEQQKMGVMAASLALNDSGDSFFFFLFRLFHTKNMYLAEVNIIQLNKQKESLQRTAIRNAAIPECLLGL